MFTFALDTDVSLRQCCPPISKERLLSLVSEEDVFKLVFGCIPSVSTKYLSPFRQDTNPGCSFYYSHKGELRFSDFATRTNLNCFDAVQRYYSLPSFADTISFIMDKLIDHKDLATCTKAVSTVSSHHHNQKPSKTISIIPRAFTKKDLRYWNSFGISLYNLIEDNIRPVLKYSITQGKHTATFNTISSCYCLGSFSMDRKKLYFPNQQFRFLSTCLPKDIGLIATLPREGRTLIISKSYKDCRLLRNLGYTSCWFQNEVTLPPISILTNLVQRFNRIIVFFDNDLAGITGSSSLTNAFNSIRANASVAYHLDPSLLSSHRITDPSDFVQVYGLSNLKQELTNQLPI